MHLLDVLRCLVLITCFVNQTGISPVQSWIIMPTHDDLWSEDDSQSSVDVLYLVWAGALHARTNWIANG
eukprot:scaffold91641_cov31-Tisochrysis_lutea.AAC.1